METNADFMYMFGYSNHPTEENPTAFFEFKDHKPEHLEKYFGFRAHNEQVIKQMAADGGWKGPKYVINRDEVFDLLPADMVEKVQEPARDWANRKLGYTKV